MKKLLLCTVFIATIVPSFAQAQGEPAVSAVAPTTAPVTDVGAPVPATPDAPSATAQPQVAPMADGTVVASAPPATTAVAEPDALIPVPATPIEKAISEQLSFQKPTVNVNMMPSLFFTVWEHDLVIDARRGLTTRMPGTDDGVTQTGPRDVALGGIVYRGAKNWVIWLNELQVSPTAIPDEVIDLKVFKDYVELEWFDASTNQIFPIRLRPHQRFNLDTRMFLPG